MEGYVTHQLFSGANDAQQLKLEASIYLYMQHSAEATEDLYVVGVK